MDQSEIIKAIEAHAKDFGIRVTTIGQVAVNNRHAYDRIKAGRAHRATETTLLEWLKSDREIREAAQVAQ